LIRTLALVLSLCIAAGPQLPRPIQADPRIAAHLPLARAMACKFLPRMGGMLELDDLVSVALTAVWVAAPDFDKARGVTFGQFARKCIWNALRRHQRDIWKQQRRAWLQQVSIHPQSDEERGIELPTTWPDPERAYAAFQIATQVVEAGNERDRELLRQLLLGETLVDAGNDAGISKQRAHEIQERAFRIVRKRVERKERRV